MAIVATERANRMPPAVRQQLEVEVVSILSKGFQKNQQAVRDLIKRCIEADTSVRQKKRKRTEDAAWASSDMCTLIETLRSDDVGNLFVYGEGGCLKLMYSTLARNVALKSTIVVLTETDTSSSESADEATTSVSQDDDGGDGVADCPEDTSDGGRKRSALNKATLRVGRYLEMLSKELLVELKAILTETGKSADKVVLHGFRDSLAGNRGQTRGAGLVFSESSEAVEAVEMLQAATKRVSTRFC
jgi:hypothetical protein